MEDNSRSQTRRIPPPIQPSRQAEHQQLGPFMRALKAIRSPVLDRLEPEELEAHRRKQEALGRLAAPMAGMRWETFDLDGTQAAWTCPIDGHNDRRCILYCHGGGYVSGNLEYSRILASKLAHATGYEVLSFDYRLAPEHPYPAAVDDAVKAWDHLMYQGYGAREVVVAGDSAGGNLALALTQQLKAAGRRLPGALVLLSPWTDMTASGKSYQERAEIDPILTPSYIHAVRELYAGGRDWSLPQLSPLFGELAGFPPTLIQVGTNEILLSDAVRLRDRLIRAAVPCRLEVWHDMWHVFQMFPIRKAGRALERIRSFVQELP